MVHVLGIKTYTKPYSYHQYKVEFFY